MPNKVRRLVTQTWQTEASLSVFLVLLVVTIFVLPAIGFARHDQRLYTDCCYTIILAAGVGIAWRSRALFWTSAAIALVAITLKWLDLFHLSRELGVWPDSVSLAAIALVLFILLKQVFSVGAISSMRIQGAVAVYLGFGIAWAHAFHIASSLVPGSFSTTGATTASVSDWVYFSFVTLTTVGYGDIVPVGPVARSLAVGEAVAGQLYLAVLLAHLVSMRVSGLDYRGNSKKSSGQVDDV